MENFQAYQGDVGLLKTDKVPDLTFKPLPEDGLIVAWGEVTGHNHKIVADREAIVEMAQDQFGTYIKVLKGQAQIKHQEHEAQVLTPGIWFVVSQFEYDEVQELRGVQD